MSKQRKDDAHCRKIRGLGFCGISFGGRDNEASDSSGSDVIGYRGTGNCIGVGHYELGPILPIGAYHCIDGSGLAFGCGAELDGWIGRQRLGYWLCPVPECILNFGNQNQNH